MPSLSLCRSWQLTHGERADDKVHRAPGGLGVGAAVGTAIDDLGTGIWIGAVIGVGLGLLVDSLRR